MTASMQARKLLAEATNTAVDAIPDDARIGNCGARDSIAHLRLILAVEEQLGRQLDPDEAIEIESLRDIAALLEAKGSGPRAS